MKTELTRPSTKGKRCMPCKGIKKSVLWLLFFTILSFMYAGVSFAGTYYVSSSGSGSTCSSATPCAASYAMAHAVAGDTWIFQSGTYWVGTQSSSDYRAPILGPANSGTAGNPITFMSQTPLGAVMVGVSVVANNGNGLDTPGVANVIGSENKQYIIWNGFKLEAFTTNGGTTPAVPQIAITDGGNSNYNLGNEVINCECVGTSIANGGGNIALIRLEYQQNALIQNNYLHDISDPTGDHNVEGLWTFMTQGITVTQNTFYNNSENIFSKYGSINDTYSLNLLLPITAAGISYGNASFFIQNFEGPVTNMTITQNIIIGSLMSVLFNPAEGGGEPNSISIYNNTMYNASTVAYAVSTSDLGATWSAWNNIIAAPSGSDYLFWEYANEVPTVLDYNDYYALGGSPVWGDQIYATNYTTSSLSSWQTHTGFDTHSVTTNPNFVNGSGAFSLATDFKRSSYPTNGRGGSYAAVMGAYITGNETIGYTTASTVPPMPPVMSAPVH